MSSNVEHPFKGTSLVDIWSAVRLWKIATMMPSCSPLEDILVGFGGCLWARLATRGGYNVLSIEVGIVSICFSGCICCAPLDLLPKHGKAEILLTPDELVVVVGSNVHHSFFGDALEAIKV